MEHIKTDDTVFFTANFYHPASGYSIAADTLPQYLVYKGAATTPIINGAMVARTNHVGSYVGSVVASVANGFDSSTFYDIQASGAVTVAGEVIEGISSVKQFELNDVVDARVTSLGYAASGDIAAAVWQATQSSYDTPGTTGHSLVVASGNLIENSTTSSQLTTIAGDVVNIDGAAMRGTDNAALASNLISVSGVVNAVKTKTDYLPSATAGAAGGVFIAGTNAPVTITGAGNALTVSSTSAGNGVRIISNGVGTAGIDITGVQYGVKTVGNVGSYIYGSSSTGLYLTGATEGLFVGDGVIMPNNWLVAADINSDAVTKIQAGVATATNLEAVSGVLVARTRLNADYFDWTTDPVSVSGEVVTDSASRTASQADITSLATTTQLMSVSGSVLDANIVSVSGQYVEPKTTYDANVVQVSGEVVSINDFKGEASSLTTDGIADAVWTEVIADHTATAGGAAQALVTASGNLIGSTSVSAADIADAVWDENLADHAGGTSTGQALVTASGNLIGNTSVSAADIADAVWDETLSDHDTPGGAGHALVTASGNLISGDWSTHATPDLSALATGTNLEAVSGVLVARSLAAADYFDPSADTVTNVTNVATVTNGPTLDHLMSVSGVVDTIAIDVAGLDGDAMRGTDNAVLHTNFMLVSGVMVERTRLDADYFSWTTDAVSVSGVVDSNVIKVSGEYVDIGQFVGEASSLTTDGIADAVWTEVIADHTATAGGAAQALVTASGNLIGSTSVSAADIADAVWDETLSDHDTPGGAGHALVTASGNLISGDWSTHGDPDLSALATGTNLEAVSGVLVARTRLDADYFSWTSDPVSVSGIVDANVVQVSGEYISLTNSMDANIVQVSGEVVDIGSFSPTSAEIADSVWDETLSDHVADGGAGQALVTASGNLIGSTSVSAADIRAEMDSNSTKLIAISGSVAGLAGAAMRGTDSAALASDLEAVSGVMVARTRLDADYFSWTTDPVSVSGEVVTDSASRTASQADVTSLATTAQLMSVSGSVLDANIVQVSGVGVGLSTATINANVVQVSGEQVDIGNFRADVSNLDSDVYFANVRYIKDTANSQDEFAVQWFTNDQPVSSGDLTSPAISVYNTTTGASIFEHQLMTYASPNLGVVRYNNSSVMASGEPYLVETSGTIAAGLRTWKTIVGIDSL